MANDSAPAQVALDDNSLLSIVTGSPVFGNNGHGREDNLYTTVNESAVADGITNTSSMVTAPMFWNHPEDPMTLEQMELTSSITNLVLSPFLFVVGCPTNLLSCLVFYKQGLRDRMNLCLFVLGLVDTAYLLVSFVTGFYAFIRLWDPTLAREYSARGVVWFVWALSGMKLSSGCISMVVAVERCVCVVCPLRANTIMKTRTMGALLALAVILPNLGESIMSYRHKIIRVEDTDTGLINFQISVTQFFLDHPMVYEAIHDILLNLLLPLVTFVMVGVVTAVTVITLRTAIAWRAKTATSGKGHNQGQQQQAALTKMLVILSCVYMVCSTPLASMSIGRLMVPGFSTTGKYSNFFFACSILGAQVFGPLNSAVNFFVYYWRSSRFRVELHRVFCPRQNTQVVKEESSKFTVVEPVNSVCE